MIEQIASVIKVEADGAWLSTRPVTTCQSCHASTDCGTGIIAKTLTPRRSTFFLATSEALLPGQQVRIGTTEQRLVVAALSLYLLPLLLMMLLLFTVNWLWPAAHELLLIALAGAALWLGFWLARLIAPAQERDAVVLLEVLPELSVQNLPV
ncbi:MAG: SoxR reducing system RseC family protein [Alkalimonas sp.]|nr:SoxR reducing system RseC family protein [Alkalimonas sp.]